MFGSDTNARFSRGAASRIDAASSLNVLGFVYAAGNQALARNGSELSFAAAFATVYSPTMYRWYVSPGGGREYTRVAVDGSAQTIISNGAGDVLRGVYGQFVYYDSAGNFNGGVITPTPVSSTFDLVNDGTNILRLTVAADGSVTIARAGGSRTYDVNIRLMWL